MGSTADSFLSPALAKISVTLGMSESLAGVTLLALGNGAPDVITALAASGDEDGGIFLAVGSLMGGGLFISGIVSAVVIFSSDKPIHLLGRTMLRDIGFYIISLLILLSASFIGELSLPIGIAFLLLYVSYVIYVVVQDKIDQRIKVRHNEERKTIAVKRETNIELSYHEQKLLEDEDLEEDAYFVFDSNDRVVDIEIERPDEEKNYRLSFKKMFDGRSTNMPESVKGFAINQDDRMKTFSLNSQSSGNIKGSDESSEVLDEPEGSRNSNKILEAAKDVTVKLDGNSSLDSYIMEDYVEDEETDRMTDKNIIKHKSDLNLAITETKFKIVWSMLKLKKFFVKGVENEKSFKDMSIIDKLFFIFLDAPFDFLRRLTIPPGSADQWNRRFASIGPIFTVLFIFFATKIYTFDSAPPIAFYVLEGVAIVLGITIWFTTPLTSPPKKGLIVFSFAWFFTSILWIYLCANTLVDLIQFLGLALDIYPAFLGITILAAGLSTADLKVNAAVAKQGLARMALTGWFAGPMFNLLVGLGSSIVMTIAKGNSAPQFKYKEKDAILPLMGIGTLLAQLIIITIISVISKFYLKKPQAVIQIIYWVLAISFITVATFTFANM